MYRPKFILTTIVVTLFGFGLHTLYGQRWFPEILNESAKNGALDNLLRPPYPVHVVFISAITAIIPSEFKIMTYYFAGHLPPFRSTLANSMLSGLILVGLSGELIRMPIMSLVIGNPGYLVIAQSAEPWLIGLGTGVIIAFSVTPITPYKSSKDI